MNPRMTSLCLFFKLSVKYDNYHFRERIIHAEDSHISSFTTINIFLLIACLDLFIKKFPIKRDFSTEKSLLYFYNIFSITALEVLSLFVSDTCPVFR